MRGQKWGFSLTLTVAVRTGQHYGAVCDISAYTRCAVL